MQCFLEKKMHRSKMCIQGIQSDMCLYKIERETHRFTERSSLCSFNSLGFGQMCDVTLRVSSFSENQIKDDLRTCMECVIRGMVSTTTTWLIGTTPGGSATTPISSNDGEVVNGVLVIFDPSTIIPGLGNANGIRVACSAGGTSLNFFIILDGIFVCVFHLCTLHTHTHTHTHSHILFL